MSDTQSNDALVAAFRQQYVASQQLEAELAESEKRITELVDQLSAVTGKHQQLREAVEEARAELDRLAIRVPDATIGAVWSEEQPGAGERRTFSKLSHQEQVAWVYQHLRHGPLSQDAICRQFEQLMTDDAGVLTDFLASSKYFRQAGEAEILWEISANRENDLRSLLDTTEL